MKLENRKKKHGVAVTKIDVVRFYSRLVKTYVNTHLEATLLFTWIAACSVAENNFYVDYNINFSLLSGKEP
jgi:hypothetical protein